MSLRVGTRIIETLREDSDLTLMLTQGEAAIGLGLLPSGTLTPYVSVFEVSGVPSYTLGNSEAYSSELYDIYVYAEDDDDESAPTVAERVLDRIYEVLQNNEIAVAGRNVKSLRRGAERSSKWETVSSSERYFRAGHQWEVMTGPST